MRLTNSEETYGLIHQVLHWTVALLILSMLALGQYMHELPHATQAEIDYKVWFYSLHKTIGIATLGLAVLRILWAWWQPHPRLLNGGVEAVAAKTIHILLYTMIIAVPIFGWLHHAASTGFAPIWWGFGDDLPFIPKSDDLSNFFATAHWLAAIGMVLALLLHIGGAIKHAVFDKDRTLQRMVPGRYIETGVLPEQVDTGRSPVVLALAALALGAAAIVVVHLGFGSSHSQAPVVAAQGSETAAKSASANWIVDLEQSELTLTIQQMGAPVEARFGQFSADVFFEPAAPETAKIEVRVPVASLDFGSNTKQALSPDFLNAASYPEAVFKSENVTGADGAYSAQGTLTLVGISQPVTLDFTFTETGDVAKVTGSTELKRLDFGVGKTYQGDDTVGQVVRVIFNLTANRK